MQIIINLKHPRLKPFKSWSSSSNEYNQHQLYGWLATGAYQVIAGKIDQPLLEHFLSVLRAVPKGRDFLKCFRIFFEEYFARINAKQFNFVFIF